MSQLTEKPNPRFVSSTLSLGTFSIITVVLGFAGTVIMARQFTPAVFGAYTITLVMVSFLGQISTFGLELGIARFTAGAGDEETKARFFGTGVMMRLGAILVTCLLAWLGRPYLQALFGGDLLPDIFLFVPLLFALDSTRFFLRSVLQGSLLFARIGQADVIASGLNFTLLLVMIYFLGNRSASDLILIRVISSFAASVFIYLCIPIKKKIAFDLAACKQLIQFGYPLQINDVLQFIQSRIDTMMVAALLGPANVALYEVARKIPDNLRSLYEPFRSVYYPFLARHYELEDPNRASHLLNDSLRFISFAILFGTAIAVLFSQEIIRLLFSEQYAASAPVFVILMVNLSIALISNVMGTTLVAMGDSNKPLIINTFNASISLLASLLLVPVYQIIGAGLANTLGTACAYPLNIYFLRRKIHFQNSAYLKPLLLLCAWSLLVVLIAPASFILKLGLLSIFLVGCVFLSIITKEDIQRLMKGAGISAAEHL